MSSSGPTAAAAAASAAPSRSVAAAASRRASTRAPVSAPTAAAAPGTATGTAPLPCATGAVLGCSSAITATTEPGASPPRRASSRAASATRARASASARRASATAARASASPVRSSATASRSATSARSSSICAVRRRAPFSSSSSCASLRSSRARRVLRLDPAVVLGRQLSPHRRQLAGGPPGGGLGGVDPLARRPLLALLGGGWFAGLLGGDQLGRLVGPAVGAVQPQPPEPAGQLLVHHARDALAELVVGVDGTPHGPEGGARQLLEPQVRLERRGARHRRAQAGAGDGDGEGHLDGRPQRLVRDRRWFTGANSSGEHRSASVPRRAHQ